MFGGLVIAVYIVVVILFIFSLVGFLKYEMFC